jgi:hypothetical protein
MVSLEKKVSDVKLIKKILSSLPERFRIKVTTIEKVGWPLIPKRAYCA